MAKEINLRISKIKEIYFKQGAEAAKKYVYTIFHLKLTNSEIRTIIGVPHNNHSFVVEAHKVAWNICGWSKSINGGNYQSENQSTYRSVCTTQAWDTIKRDVK